MQSSSVNITQRLAAVTFVENVTPKQQAWLCQQLNTTPIKDVPQTKCTLMLYGRRNMNNLRFLLSKCPYKSKSQLSQQSDNNNEWNRENEEDNKKDLE